MYFNYRKEKAKFLADWAEEEKLLRSQNASEEVITEMYRFSFEQFKSNRNYYLHKEDFVSDDDLSEEMDLDANLGFLDKIEDEQVKRILERLKTSDIELILLLCEKGMTQAEIARQLGQTRANITIKLKRIKKLFENT